MYTLVIQTEMEYQQLTEIKEEQAVVSMLLGGLVI